MHFFKVTNASLAALAGLSLLFGVGSASAGTIICIGDGNEFGDDSCDYTEFNDFFASDPSWTDLTGNGDIDVLGKHDLPSTMTGPNDLTVTQTIVSPGLGETVEWTMDGTDVPAIWVEKYDGLYTVYEYMGPTSGIGDSGTRPTDDNFLDLYGIECGNEPGGNPNCSAGTSHVAAYGWAPGTGNAPPVPIPAALWLFGSALLGFIGVSRRANRA